MYNIKNARVQAGLKQKDVAKLLKVTAATYSRYENGLIRPDPDTLLEISKILNTTVDYLLGREATPPPAEPQATSLTPSEETHIKKYRRLDTDGKKRIDKQIDFELYQIEQNAEKEEVNCG